MDWILIIIVASAMVLLVSYIYGQHHERTYGAHHVCLYFKKKKPFMFEDFKYHCRAMPFYDNSLLLDQQDWTMFVGMCKGFFSKYGIDCGVSSSDIIKAINKL